MSKIGLDSVLKKIEQTKKVIPTVVANQATNCFLDGFKKQGFTDTGLKKWEEVQRRIKGTSAYKYPKKKQLSRRTSPILVRTGKLRRAVGNSVRTKTFNQIVLVVGIDYASYHNDGTKKIPKREFMKDSATLSRMQKTLIDTKFKEIWQA